MKYDFPFYFPGYYSAKDTSLYVDAVTYATGSTSHYTPRETDR